MTTGVDRVLTKYADSNGSGYELDSIRDTLQARLDSEVHGCLVCLESVERQQAVWSCRTCYETYHLQCMQQWAGQQIQLAEYAAQEPHNTDAPIVWYCPKCRHEYTRIQRPDKYYCFCGKVENPKPDRWSIAHSCDGTCERQLQCRHHCRLLCHPGPCPECPVIVQVSCHCGSAPKRAVRCAQRSWSCQQLCNRLLSCGVHRCADVCHAGECRPCTNTSEQSCRCGRVRQLRPCVEATEGFSCGRVCDRQLACGRHRCEKECHKGKCAPCIRPGTDTCACGKQRYTNVNCVDDVPCCGDTCGRKLSCGVHECFAKCHRGDCPPCMVSVSAPCRCGAKKITGACSALRECDVKCKRKRQCQRHACNRRCCNGNCPPCEQQCGRPLNCGRHRCLAPCHPGSCYPCALDVELSCACGKTRRTVPCGRAKKARVPVCDKPCNRPPTCHHRRENGPQHKCHEDAECPPCTLICALLYKCGHSCRSKCHDHVLVDRNAADNAKARGFWDRKEKALEYIAQPCPPCMEPVQVMCIGGHNSIPMPCTQQRLVSCGGKCGAPLPCGNHLCTLQCHDASTEHEECSLQCALPRSCPHECPLPCHRPPCPRCRLSVQHPCHCAVNTIYTPCSRWQQMSAEERDKALSCGNVCPKMLSCTHQCVKTCHSGECSDVSACTRKVKIRCPCGRRIQKAICNQAEKELQCDEECEALARSSREAEERAATVANRTATSDAIDSMEQPTGGRRRNRKKKQVEVEKARNLWSKLKMPVIVALIAVIFAFTAYALAYF